MVTADAVDIDDITRLLGRAPEGRFAVEVRGADGAPLVARWHKQFIERLTVHADIAPEEWDTGFACFDTDDYRTGVKAFLAKAKPEFEGR